MAKIIELTKGKRTIVDDDDYDFLMQWRWVAFRTPKPVAEYYAVRTFRNHQPDGTQKCGAIRMHNAIFQVPKGFKVDHIDRDGLNNQKSNLRQATTSQNNANKGPCSNNQSGFKGVSLVRANRSRPWAATVSHNRQVIYKEVFATREEAARAYDRAAKAFFGEFSYQNFPDK